MNASKQFVAMPKAELAKEITSIAKTGNRLNTRIQLAAMNAIYYSIQEGYIQYGQNLVMALNNGQRKNSLVAFLEKHGKFQWSKENKSLVFKKRDDLSVESIAEIKEHWFEAIKAPEPKSMYDFEDEVNRFIKKMEKAVTDKATIKHVEIMDYVHAAIAQYHEDQLKTEEADADTVLSDEEQTELAELLQVAVSENNRKELRAA
jgi:hypothetical protein